MSGSCKHETNVEKTSKDAISNQSNQKHLLMEEWRISDRAIRARSLLEEERKQRQPFCAGKKVTFAEFSEQCLFINSSYRLKKSYSADDFEMFRFQASRDARRIRDLISLFPLQTESAIECVLELGLLKHENLVGLEHLVSAKVSADQVKERRTHAAFVLRAQKLLKEERVNSNEAATVKLANVASYSGSRSAEKARIRASVSLVAKQLDYENDRSVVRMRNKTHSSKLLPVDSKKIPNCTTMASLLKAEELSQDKDTDGVDTEVRAKIDNALSSSSLCSMSSDSSKLNASTLIPVIRAGARKTASKARSPAAHAA